jgi:hypothetical protein
MRVGQVQIAQFEVSGPRPAAYEAERDTAGPLADADFDWQILSFLAITLALLTYGCYLTWESRQKLLWLVASSAARDLAVVATTIHVVAPLLPPLSYLVVYLSWRRDGSWCLRAGTLCLLGLLTAAIEVFVPALG